MNDSFINGILADSGTPEVGGGATFLYFSDRSPATVGPNKGNPRLIRVQVDNWTVTSGSEHDGSAQYEFL